MRVLAVLTGALVINTGLFVLMDGMISRDRTRLQQGVAAQTIDFVRTAVDDETKTKDRRRTPPPKPRELPKPRAVVDSIAHRAELPAAFEAYQVSSLLGEGGGIALGPRIVAGSGSALRMMMASDLIAISKIPPQYPPWALAQEIEGWVDLTFVVTSEGRVDRPTVVEAQPPGTFDDAAIAAAARWRFRPYQENGEPVPVRVYLHIDFEIH